IRVGLICARDNAAVSAIVKQPACAAPINSSGLVADSPSSNRDLNEYGPSNAPLPTFNRPLPSARLPVHSASAFLDGIYIYPFFYIFVPLPPGFWFRVQQGSQFSARVCSFPVAPQAQSLSQMLRAQLNKMTEQPHERLEILVLVLFSCFVDLIAETLDPDVAIMNVTERRLHLRCAFSECRNRSSPALLEQLDRITQSLRRDTHLVKCFDFERPKQSVTQLFQLLQTVEN